MADDIRSDLDIEADVLVIGGGPAGTWAAAKAAEAGASVVLVDKGYCGTSGATAAAGTGVWYVPPIAERARGGHGQPRGARRPPGRPPLDGPGARRDLGPGARARASAATRSRSTTEAGRRMRSGLQGPEYMKRHAPAGRAAPACASSTTARRSSCSSTPTARSRAPHGLRRQAGAALPRARRRRRARHRRLRLPEPRARLQRRHRRRRPVRREVGAELSGMEFSNSYAIAPAITSVTKSAFYHWATFYREDGSVLEGAGSPARPLGDRPHPARPSRCTASSTSADDELQAAACASLQPNFFLPFDRLGIDPFTAALPGHPAARGHGARHRRRPDRRRRLRHHGARPVRRRRRRHPRADLRRLHRRRQPQRRLGDLARASWAGDGAAGTRCRSVQPARHRDRARGAGTAGLRPTGTPGAPDEHREVVDDRAGRGHALRQELLPHRTPA